MIEDGTQRAAGGFAMNARSTAGSPIPNRSRYWRRNSSAASADAPAAGNDVAGSPLRWRTLRGRSGSACSKDSGRPPVPAGDPRDPPLLLEPRVGAKHRKTLEARVREHRSRRGRLASGRRLPRHRSAANGGRIAVEARLRCVAVPIEEEGPGIRRVCGR